ncbi:hypothetical protein GCM10017608_25710 [Agromyces luteolus]|uniref:PH domain-containing protein n=1 Tax=Agromyces luteolus TaxID=88373 RepID=A0A7C9HJY5_9MICO|nr:PH domain-containing protein [Agromyces luteolus]MUN08948.1 PH domain-containing protein [Agromyces luteolus]GLK28636.1 hypothetical protein GCM10017608_25710 [Agromyces luteolus]
MIDLQNGTIVKLSKADVASIEPSVPELYVGGESSMVAAKDMRDFIMFTNERIIALNVQGMTGTKRDTTSLPYSKIQAFSIETAGGFDGDAELEIWLSGLGRVRLKFAGTSTPATSRSSSGGRCCRRGAPSGERATGVACGPRNGVTTAPHSPPSDRPHET